MAMFSLPCPTGSLRFETNWNLKSSRHRPLHSFLVESDAACVQELSTIRDFLYWGDRDEIYFKGMHKNVFFKISQAWSAAWCGSKTPSRLHERLH